MIHTRVLSFSFNNLLQDHSNVALPTTAIEPTKRSTNRAPSLVLLSSADDVTQNSDTTESESELNNRVSISRPLIHWTVPGFKVGWQDENGNWFDEDGPRNGPPQNYWRQMSDEREYKMDMDALDSVMGECSSDIDIGIDIEETVAKLEKRRSVRYPSLSRKVLGRWVPILLCGERVALNSSEPADNKGDIEAPFVVEICRSNGRLYGPKNYYGIFDKKLSCGEDLTFKVMMGEGESIISSTNTVAGNSNELMVLKMLPNNKPLYYGGITYITDYIMIQRGQGGDINFCLRADDSYLGVIDPNVGMGEIKVE